MPIVISPVMWKKSPPMIANGRMRVAMPVSGHDRHARLQRRVSLGVLNRVAGFVRGDAERGDRRRLIDVAGKAKPLLRRIVVIAEVVVDLDHFDVANVRGLQNFPGRFRAGDVRARAHRAPFLERAAHAELRPETDEQRDADEQKIVGREKHPAPVTVGMIHVR